MADAVRMRVRRRARRVRVDPLTRLWSVWLPRRLRPWAPRLADAFADGAWTAAVPGLAALLPLVAFYVGWNTPKFWPGAVIDYSYTESLSFMATSIAAAILSGPAGLMLLLGFSLQDLISPNYFLTKHSVVESFVRQRGSQLLSYLLLAIPVFAFPSLARLIAESARQRLPDVVKGRLDVRAASYALAWGVLVYLWSQAMIVLIRPMYTWWPATPDVGAFAPIQQHWMLLAGAVMIAAAARVVLEDFALRRSRGEEAVADLYEQRLINHESAPRFRLPPLVQVVLTAGLVALLLAGVSERWRDTLLVFAVGALLGAWYAGLLGRVPGWWTRATDRAPAGLRFVVPVIIAYVLTYEQFGGHTPKSFFPVVLGALAAIVAFALLFPPNAVSREGN